MYRRINFQSLPVDDQQRALEFYRDILGFTVKTDAPYEDGWRWIFLQILKADTMLHLARRDEISVLKGPALCLVCDDADAEAERLAALGVSIADGPADAPWHPAVRWALFHDSEDNLVLIQSSRMEA